MNSRLFECRLLHAREWPRPHRFENRIFFLALDLDEHEALARRLRLFTRGRRGFYSVRDADYLPAQADSGAGGASPPLRERVRRLLEVHGIALAPSDCVVLVTLPRIAGYHFNPVSFYFCWREERPLCAIAEVTNTFREVKSYVLGGDTLRPDGSFVLRTPKNFYVSPFSDPHTEFEFALRCGDRTLAVRIDEFQHGRRILHSVVTGRQAPLRDRTLAWFAVKYPLLSLQVILRIHLQALRLYLKRLPWRRKDELAEMQQGYYPAHPPHSTPPA